MPDAIDAVLRHFAGNAAQVEELGVMARRLADAQAYQDGTGGPIRYRLALGTPDPRTAKAEVYTPAVHTGLAEYVSQLRRAGIEVDWATGRGIGEAFNNATFDYLRERGVRTGTRQAKVLVDGNQFDVSDKRVSTGIVNMAERLWERDWLLGLGLRDYVVLAADPRDKAIREIEELLHLFVTPKIIEVANPQGISTDDIHPAYMRFGDEIPGLWVVNLESQAPRFTDVVEAAHVDANRANLNGYAADPYASILMRVLSERYGRRVYSEVVPTTRTVRGSRFDRKTIVDKGRELRKTSIGRDYKSAVLDGDHGLWLAKYGYRGDVVQETVEMIMEGIRQAEGLLDEVPAAAASGATA